MESLSADGCGSIVQDRRIHFAWIDIRDPDTFLTDFVRDRSAECRHRKLAGTVNLQRSHQFAGNGRNVDDQTVFRRPHRGQDFVHAAVRTGRVSSEARGPSPPANIAIILDLSTGTVDQNVNVTNVAWQVGKKDCNLWDRRRPNRVCSDRS